ncbi:MAG: hypothetical protein COV71_01630 [Candidatus Omnitrophica bacterium CG11_big_fil_rev_8_21_14_0_20_41_12]|nr:MAG: hypothetical protein COV71_01630 [Candidatus Omnitrophica bacterium CG11_big_fil_rev_8_21_14_0_20_41_12]
MPLNLKIRITLIVLFVSLVTSIAAFGATSVNFNGQINATNINLRVDATVGSAVICVLAKGELVEVVSEAHDWYKIRLPKEAPSYVREDLVECFNSDPVTNPGKCLSAKVIKDRINIRLGPSESSWILGKADKLTVVNILTKENGWYKIQPIYQSYGWVNKKFVNKEVLLPKKQEAIEAPVKDIPQSSAKEIQSSDPLVIEGMVSPYGVVLWRQATHKLITSENKVYFLKGNRKSLDSLNYHKVKVSGKLISPAGSKHPIVGVNIIEALN